MLSNWMSICLYQYLKVGLSGLARVGAGVRGCSPRPPPKHPPARGASPVSPVAELPFALQDSAGEPLYKLFKAIKHQVEKGPVDAVQKKAKYTLNDTGLLGDDVEYAPLVSTAAGGAWAASGADAGCHSQTRTGPPEFGGGGLCTLRGCWAPKVSLQRGSEYPESAASRAPGSPAALCGASRCDWW